MVDDKCFFFRSSSYIARLPYFAINMDFDTWILFLMFDFPILQYTISTHWLLLHLNSETTSQHPIGTIDIQMHGTHHSKSDCMNHLYYLCEIESLQYFLLQYRQMYTKYYARKICHFQEMISFLILFFNITP